MPSSHLILGRPLLLLPPIPLSIKVFSNESTLRMRWPKYRTFSFSIIPSKEIPGLISFRMDWCYFNKIKFLSTLIATFSDLSMSFIGKPFAVFCLCLTSWILKEKLPRSVGAQYATGDQWRNNSRKNEGMEPKQKQYPAVDVTGDRSKV